MIYFVLGLAYAVVGALPTLFFRNWRLSLTVFGVLFGVGVLLGFVARPVISLEYGSFYVYFISAIIIGVGLSSPFVDETPNLAGGVPPINVIPPVIAIICVVGLVIGYVVTTHSAFHANAYAQLLEVESVEDFKPSKVFLDQSQARTVDQSLAHRSASEILGRKSNIPWSRYELGAMKIQQVGDGLRWVAPFYHSSMTRWFFGDATPGFASVSISDYSDATLSVDDTHRMRYGVDGFYFSSYLPRHLYSEGYRHRDKANYTLEVNDEGQPRWVVSVLEPQVGFSGKTVTAVLVVDPYSGEITEYDGDAIPGWVDRVKPGWLVYDHIEWFGKYVKDSSFSSWVNAVFIGDQLIEPTNGAYMVQTSEGKPAWYTGMRYASVDGQATTGFMMVDTTSGESTFYRRSGITEEAAQAAIQGQVQESEYTSSSPIPYNVGGVSTFISVLKDDNGNPQRIAMVAYNDRTIVATGETVDRAMRRYLAKLEDQDQEIDLEEGVSATTIQGDIERLVRLHNESATIIHFMLASSPKAKGKIFKVSGESSPQALMTKEGDSVAFEVMQMDDTVITARRFENNDIRLD